MEQTAPDLSDPKVLKDQCRLYAEGLRRQAESVGMHSAQGGHPYPEFFFSQVGAILEACATFFERIPVATPEKPQKK